MVLSGRRDTGIWVCLGLATIVAFYVVMLTGVPIAGAHGEAREQQRIAGILVGALGLVYWLATLGRKPLPGLGRWIEWPLFLLPVYSLFQVIPLPPAIVRILSPARFELSQALG